jgi:hypothetical protein
MLYRPDHPVRRRRNRPSSWMDAYVTGPDEAFGSTGATSGAPSAIALDPVTGSGRKHA